MKLTPLAAYVVLWGLSMPIELHRGALTARGPLEVAMAMIGNPRIVFLDEPSTGLDPASRRKLWDTISKAKLKSCVILTTHSMEVCTEDLRCFLPPLDSLLD